MLAGVRVPNEFTFIFRSYSGGRGGGTRRNALGLQVKCPPNLSDLKKDDGCSVYWPLTGNAKAS